jgi:hypothetical protein
MDPRRGEKRREEVLNLMAGGEEMEALELDLDEELEEEPSLTDARL